MSFQLYLINGYRVELTVANVGINHKLDSELVAVYATNAQLPSMPMADNCCLVGMVNGKTAYLESTNIALFDEFVANGNGLFSFTIQRVIVDDDELVDTIKLKTGATIYFIVKQSIYTVNVVNVYSNYELQQTRDSAHATTFELIEYITREFVNDYIGTLPKFEGLDLDINTLQGHVVHAERAESSTQDVVNKLMSSIENLQVESEQRAEIIKNSPLSIANDSSVIASAPIMDADVARNHANYVNEVIAFKGLRRPEPIAVSTVPTISRNGGDFRIDSNSYILDDAPEEIELTPQQPLLKRATTPYGVKAWKVHFVIGANVKITFDKLIPACKLERVRHCENGNVHKISLSSIRKDGAFDCAYITVNKGEYIYFLANGIYIDVKITNVEFYDNLPKIE
ncbi:hypothetical protein F-LCD7_0147 [Faustovirus]|nr:hypothetical protein F-LCD7_0147 [Faustovirus]